MSLVGLIFWAAVQPGDCQEHVTDEIIAGAFRRAHDVMKDLRTGLEVILDGFLTGKIERIQEQADRIAERMNQVSREYPPQSDAEATEWKALADIVSQARLLRESVKVGNYQAAYQHYSLLANRCIACHQVRRQWGQFVEPDTKKSEPKAQEKAHPVTEEQ